MAATPPSEEKLVADAIAGDQNALSALLKLYGPRIREGLAGSIPRKWQSVLSVDDVMQQAYVDAFRAIGQFVQRQDGSFSGWLATLAKRNLVDALRGLEADKRGGNRQRVGGGGEDDNVLDLYETLSGTTSTPSRHAARDEARGFLHRALQALPENYRKIVQMYDIEGRSIEEVSALLNKSAGAIYMLRSRAHRRLGEILGSSSRFVSGS